MLSSLFLTQGIANEIKQNPKEQVRLKILKMENDLAKDMIWVNDDLVVSVKDTKISRWYIDVLCKEINQSKLLPRMDFNIILLETKEFIKIKDTESLVLSGKICSIE